MPTCCGACFFLDCDGEALGFGLGGEDRRAAAETAAAGDFDALANSAAVRRGVVATTGFGGLALRERFFGGIRVVCESRLLVMMMRVRVKHDGLS